MAFRKIWYLSVIAFLGLSGFTFTATAQTGNYFLSHYAPDDDRVDYLTYDETQDDNGVLYFANKSGILSFDGRNWTLIPTPGPVYTVLAVGKEVYVGGSAGFGKLQWGNSSQQSYVSLSDTTQSYSIHNSLAVKDLVYFLGDQQTFVYSAGTGTIKKIQAPANAGDFTNVLSILGNVYLGTEASGLFKVSDTNLAPAKFSLPDSLGISFASSLKDSNKVLLGSDGSRLFIFDGDKGLKEIHLQDSYFLENNIMIDGAWVNENLVAIGTLRRGVIFIDPYTGKTKEIINFQTGLPDNEVFALLCDRNQGVWVAHDYGFTRIAPYLPFRSYNHYPGLTGNMLCAYSFNNQLYVGTTLGLFELVKEEQYEEEAVTTVYAPQVDRNLTDKTGKGKRGIFSFLKKAKKEEPVAAKKVPKAVKRTLKSVQYAFKKVEGVEGKVSQLIEAHGKLLAGGISGVFEINGDKSHTLLREPVRTVFLSGSLNQLLISTYNNEIKSYAPTNKGSWEESHLLDTLSENVNYIFEDKLQNIWLCSKSVVLKVEVVDGEISEVAPVPLHNPAMDEPVGVAWGTEVYVAASGYFNRYDIGQNRFVQFNNNKLPGAKKYFASAGYFWFYDGHRWRNVDDNLQKALKLEWLGMFSNIRFLSPTAKQEGLWVITGNNELYNFSVNKAALEQIRYPLFLREVRGQQSKIAPTRRVKINQLESTVALEFIQADFLGMKAIEYRYRVNGLSKDWSSWAVNNNVVNFSYLPIGKYRVEVQTHDLMTSSDEQIDQVEQIELEVEPPYWRRSWFYATEFAFFSILVFISIRLGSANSKYRYISRLLSLLTVIMLIQFIQTVVASQISLKSGPVIDFFIQVFIALLVLPIEGYLRKFMLRSVESSALPSRLWDVGKNLDRKAG